MGEEVGKPEPGYLSIKKRQSVPGRSLSALELLLGKRKEMRGGKKKKERKAKRDERGGKQEAGLQGWWFEKRLSI